MASGYTVTFGTLYENTMYGYSDQGTDNVCVQLIFSNGTYSPYYGNDAEYEEWPTGEVFSNVSSVYSYISKYNEDSTAYMAIGSSYCEEGEQTVPLVQNSTINGEYCHFVD